MGNSMTEVIQMPKYPCAFCKKREATQLCDFVIGYERTFFASGRDGWIDPPKRRTCDNEICSECVTSHEGFEHCPSCEELYQHVKKNHDRRPQKWMAAVAFGRVDQ